MGSGCGVIISAIDDDQLYTVCNIALPLAKCSAMHTEICGSDLLIKNLDIRTVI